MTAEEVALEEFREAAEDGRLHERIRRRHRAGTHHNRAIDIDFCSARIAESRARLRSLARIIRAIRAEREPRNGSPALQAIYDGGYARGRRDALRGVQGACLFEMGKLELLPMEYGGPCWDWEGYPEEMRAHDALREVVEAAEEAAR